MWMEEHIGMDIHEKESIREKDLTNIIKPKGSLHYI